MRHGFKKEANEIALETRKELGLVDYAPLDPLALTDLLGIPVIPLSVFEEESEHCYDHFVNTESDAFSAVTVFDGSSRVIIHNDSHSLPRQVSNLAHEAAHGLLHHLPAPALSDEGCRNWDEEIENEAAYLAGALLVTENAALHVVREEIPQTIAARHLGISKQMLTYRINVTGARQRVRRSLRKRRRPLN